MGKCVQLRTLVLGDGHPSTLSSSAALIGWPVGVDTGTSGAGECENDVSDRQNTSESIEIYFLFNKYF
jgi:hypothetical protein